MEKKRHQIVMNSDFYYELKKYAYLNNYKISEFTLMLLKKAFKEFKEERGDVE